jgi:hypothetical protein
MQRPVNAPDEMPPGHSWPEADKPATKNVAFITGTRRAWPRYDNPMNVRHGQVPRTSTASFAMPAGHKKAAAVSRGRRVGNLTCSSSLIGGGR